jgi:hypothetical protein
MENVTVLKKKFFPSVADPDPGSGAFLTSGSGSGMEKNPDLVFGISDLSLKV